MTDDLERALALEPHCDDPLTLSRNVVQIMDMLQLYQAEVARILGLQCADVAHLAQAGTRLSPDTHAWRQACLLVRCYAALYARYDGDNVAMYHWVHRDLPAFGASPHRLMVDDHALADVVAHLEQARQMKTVESPTGDL
ncbi:MAG: hypothetical protein WAL92_02590 [Thiogranum sp.]